jgi:hypothetical protein
MCRARNQEALDIPQHAARRFPQLRTRWYLEDSPDSIPE